ncbi:MAG: elongation factor 4 [Nitrospirae bacterium RIFCSPLOWO2_02_42_7]|nr:MAG: elongation factor 4 [Nitrospirae bacterium RIFCSPLOWO2_02_42_7]
MTLQEKIRNFSIIAHIDHGKSTLADRILEHTGALEPKEIKEQVLDAMDLERERGITIKAHAVRLNYNAKDGGKYIFNLIDTPGHVDFTYEVSRSLAACEGAILVVDASQGVEAQTIANTYLALESNLEILPVINKIDLPGADIEDTKQQIEEVLGLDASGAVHTSAKEGIGTVDLLEAIISKFPAPSGSIDKPLKALIFDSWYDNYQGVIVLIRVIDGKIKPGQQIKLMSTGNVFEVISLGVFTPKPVYVNELSSGEVGFVCAGIKKVGDTKIGDTLTDAGNPTKTPFPDYREVKPMVFAGLYPADTGEYKTLRDAVEKLRLNDSSFTFEPESSLALGFGFRCGFLGLLHMEIIRERLEREFGLSLISTAPTVVYKITTNNGEAFSIDSPTRLPPIHTIEIFEEPYILATIISPSEYIGAIIGLCQERRGIQRELKYVSKDRMMLTYELPLNEIVLDFYDRLKSISKGYASLDYELMGYKDSNLVKLDILLNGEVVDALSFITHRDKADIRGRQLAEKMKELIPRQMFEVIVQAAIGGKIIARETIKAMKKNVTAKCYGGDITRKRKLWEKQKKGKKRMKQFGKVEIPQEAFLAILKVKD